MQTTDRHAAPWRVNIDSSLDFENEPARQGSQLAQASQIDAKQTVPSPDSRVKSRISDRF